MSKLLYADAAGARYTGNEQTARAADVHMRHMQEASQHRKKNINTRYGAAPLMVRFLEELNFGAYPLERRVVLIMRVVLLRDRSLVASNQAHSCALASSSPARIYPTAPPAPGQ